MSVYTKTGDKGTTALLSGERVDKDCLRVEAYGSVDEISSALGLARAQAISAEVKETTLSVQKLLMLVMAEMASVDGAVYVKPEEISKLEAAIDRFQAQLPPLSSFIIPGDTIAAAALDLARTVTRRAERQFVRLRRSEAASETIGIVLNRISDLCFVMARFEAEVAGK